MPLDWGLSILSFKYLYFRLATLISAYLCNRMNTHFSYLQLIKNYFESDDGDSMFL